MKCTTELGQWHPGDLLQRREKQLVQTSFPGENVSGHRICDAVHWIWKLCICLARLNLCLFFCGFILLTDTSAFLFTPTRTARSQSNSRSPSDGVERHTVAVILTLERCITECFTVSLASIYKMFPADKKRVENALAAAHLPKGKVGEVHL